MTTKFSLEEDECLISLIKEHPEIYDNGLRAYKDYSLKAIVWRNIAANLGRSEIDCKARWKNVRDYYKKKRSEVIKDRGIGSESFDPSISTRFRLLSFLEPIIQRESLKAASKEEQSSITMDLDTSNVERINHQDIFIGESMEQFSNIKKEYDSNTEPVETDYSNNSEIESKIDQTPLINEDSHGRKRNMDDFKLRKRRRINNKISFRKTGGKAICPKNSLKTEQTVPLDPTISMFFKSIAMTVSKLTRPLQAVAKIKVLEMVTKLEMQDLSEMQKLPESKFLQNLVLGSDASSQDVTDISLPLSQLSSNCSSGDEDDFANFTTLK